MRLDRREFFRSGVVGYLVASGLGHRWVWAKPADEALSSPFLQGNFAPVQEEITAESLEVVGTIPAELNGMFVRNGPNPQFPPLGRYHWFDGDGMLHGVRICDGVASYRNRFVQTTGLQAERAAGRSLWKGLAELPDLNKLAQGQPLFKNAANTALVWHDGRLLALWEGGEPYEVKLPDLSTVGPYTYQGKLKHAFTAHPKVDPVTGEMLFFGYTGMIPAVSYSVVNADGELVSTQQVRLPRSVMMHDFAVTEHYSIFLDLPVVFDLAAITKGEPVLSYRPECGARFGILPRHGEAREVRWFEAQPCFVFHTLNAYEANNEVVLLGCRMTEFPSALGFGGAAGDSGDPLPQIQTQLYRWRFNLADGSTKEEPVDDRPVDFPRVADRLLGRATRYGYATDLHQGGLVKYDLLTGSAEEHAHGPARRGGEGVFVPRQGATAEDDGWLLTYVHDEAQGKSEMVIVDARQFTAEPVARIKIPARVPYGFHGAWVPESAWSAAAG